MSEKIRWQCVNEEPFEYAIQQGPHGDEFVKLLDGTCLRRDPSPAPEPVTTEPVAWRYQRKEWDALLWRYQTEALVNDDFETPGDWLIEPLYAIPAPPQPGRDATIEECAKVVPTNWCDSLLTGSKAERVPLSAGGVERLLRGIQDRIRALTGDPK